MKKIGIVGRSNGRSTLLAATNRRHRDVAPAQVQPALAVALYPGWEADPRRGYEVEAPLLILVGQSDDWTAPGSCRALAREASGLRPEIEGYAGAYHGFDRDARCTCAWTCPTASTRARAFKWAATVRRGALRSSAC